MATYQEAEELINEHKEELGSAYNYYIGLCNEADSRADEIIEAVNIELSERANELQRS